MKGQFVFAVLSIFLPLSSIEGQVDLFVIAAGNPGFGYRPVIDGNLVVWQRHPDRAVDPFGLGTIESRDITRLDLPVETIANFNANIGGLFLSRDYLFWGGSSLSYVWGRPRTALDGGNDILVAKFGRVVGATRDFVVIKGSSWEFKDAHKNRYFAKSFSRIADQGDDAFIEIAQYRSEAWSYHVEAVSDEYLVWQDRDPSIEAETWKIYAKKVSSRMNLDEASLVIDSKAGTQQVGNSGVLLAVRRNMILYQGAEREEEGSPLALYLHDMYRNDPPALLEVFATTQDPYIERRMGSPSLSSDYAVWRESEFDGKVRFTFRARARRIIDGEPIGQNFTIADISADRIMIDGNLAVWNDTRVEDGDFVTSSIVVAELPGTRGVGDVNQDGQIDLSDPIVILSYLFLGGWQPRRRLADFDQNGGIELTDALSIIEYLFFGGKGPG